MKTVKQISTGFGSGFQYCTIPPAARFGVVLYANVDLWSVLICLIIIKYKTLIQGQHKGQAFFSLFFTVPTGNSDKSATVALLKCLPLPMMSRKRPNDKRASVRNGSLDCKNQNSSNINATNSDLTVFSKRKYTFTNVYRTAPFIWRRNYKHHNK